MRREKRFEWTEEYLRKEFYLKNLWKFILPREEKVVYWFIARCTSALEESSSISSRHVPVSIHFAALESVDRDWMAIVTISKVDCAGHLESRMGFPARVLSSTRRPLKAEHRRFSPTSLHISVRGYESSSCGSIELSRMAVTPVSLDKCFLEQFGGIRWNRSVCASLIFIIFPALSFGSSYESIINFWHYYYFPSSVVFQQICHLIDLMEFSLIFF